MALKNAAPVNMIGAVSPAARDTSKITPVRMPLIEFGRTMWRMVCQRVAPTFQHASRNDLGTAASASLVLVMMTGSDMIASVSEAARIDLPIPANRTNAPSPNSACTMLGTPAKFSTARFTTLVNQFSLAYSFRKTAASTPMGMAMIREMTTR